MRAKVLFIIAIFLAPVQITRSQTAAHNHYLTGTFNFQSWPGIWNISERCGYNYYLTDHFAVGGYLANVSGFTLFEGKIKYSNVSWVVGPSLKYHIPKVEWLFVQPAGLLSINRTGANSSVHPWGAIGLGVDVPLNKNVFLEVAFTEQITRSEKMFFRNTLIDIGFMVGLGGAE